MASPVNGGNQGNGFDQLKAQIQAWIKEEIANALRGGIGLHLDGETGNLIIDQGEIQSGNYVPGSSGWGLLPSGNAEFNSLTLRSSIIGPAALTNPLDVGFGSNSGSNFAVGTSAAVVTYWDIPVPAGFTQAVVLVTVNASCKNTTAAADFLYVSAMAVTGSGGEADVPIAAGSWGSAAASAGQKVTGLTGGSNLRVSARVRAGTAWAADPSNIANVDAIAVFLR